MKKYGLFLGFVLLFILGVYYTYYFRPIVDDELYNFGYGVAILGGRIPYLDFNLIIPPFFCYFLSFFLKIFGNYLIIYHVVIMLMVIGITYFVFLKVGFRSLVIYFFLLIYPFTGYNVFCLFLFMFLLCMIDDDNKYSVVICALIISMMFLSKQTLGLLIVPSLFFSHHKKKTLAVYGVSVLLLIIYLLINHNMYQFFDYCFLGMFDFTSSNRVFSFFMLLEIFIIFFFLVLGLKKKKKEYFYVLCFQIIVFPIVDYVHFVIGFVPVLYYLLLCFRKNVFVTLFFCVFAFSFWAIFSWSIVFDNGKNYFLIRFDDSSMMKGRVGYSFDYINHIASYLNNYSSYDVYILGNFSYFVKLNLNIPINKYDNINNGNMGYGGYKRYIKEINDNCKNRKCLFVMNDGEVLGKIDNQSNLEILRYVNDNYYKIYISSTFSIFINS